jgi:ribonuclease Z
MVELVFLGTSSMYPTKNRAQACVFLRAGQENMLFDCGESSQRQLRVAGISPMKIDRVFISHWHGDHALGLGGLIQSLSAAGRTKDLEVYGPSRTTEHVEHILKSFEFDLRYKVKTFDIAVKSGTIKRIFETEQLAVDAMPLKHNIPCLAFAFIEKGRRKINIEYTKKFGLVRDPILGKLQEGKSITYKGKKLTPEKATFISPDKKVVYLTDTTYFDGIEKIAHDADILICESTYTEELTEKAGAYNHLTAKQAAGIAKKAGAKKLVLTHFSQRFPSTAPFEEEARKVFKETVCAKDFDKFAVK